MRHKTIPNQLFISNRQRLIKELPANALVIVQANDPIAWSTDGQGPYHPNDDLFYLTGIEQEESVLLIYPGSNDPRRRTVLFLREPNEHARIWEGELLSKQQATAISGIHEIRWLSELPVQLRIAMCEADQIFLATNEHSRAVITSEGRDLRFIHTLQQQFPVHTYRRLAPLMHRLRAIKQTEELTLLKQACAISCSGFLGVLDMLEPGVNECEVEAEFAHTFIRNKAKMAYNPIIAAGRNSCVLHYNRNDQLCQAGDVLLLDVGASYANYNADITRTFPISGQFTKRQRIVYDAVLRTVRAMTKAAVPGAKFRTWQRQCEDLVTEELLSLGLITKRAVKEESPENRACKKYFMHGCGHPLGLGVHDVAPEGAQFKPGYVITIEPGIYIPEEGFGIRLENDILITKGKGGAINLTEDIPIEVDDIESRMHKSRKKPVRSNRR